MKALLGVCLAAACLALPNAFAHGKHGGPCEKVEAACKAAGKTEKKDIWACVKTIKGGGTVEGVTVADADLQACKAAKGH